VCVCMCVSTSVRDQLRAWTAVSQMVAERREKHTCEQREKKGKGKTGLDSIDQ